MASLHRKTSSSQRTVGQSSGFDAHSASYNNNNNNNSDYNSSTQANTLANRRPSVDHNQFVASAKKQRPTTSYSALIPPPSPTYFRLQEMGTGKGGGNRNVNAQESASYSQYLQQHQQRGELDHLKPLDSRAVQSNGEADEPTTLYQRISIWMINEGNIHSP